MADTELQQLAKTDRNPIQESRYQELLRQQKQNAPAAFDPNAYLETQRRLQQELFDKQKAEEKAFLNKFTTGLDSARSALTTELGLPQLRESSMLAGQTARDVSRQIQDIPQAQQTIAKQVGISAPRLAQRTAAETTKLQPAAESARRSLEDATAAQQFGETEYTKRLQEFTQPYALEAGMLSDSLAREFTGFTKQMESELTLTLQKLANQQAVSMAEIERANQLADAESEFLRTKDLYTFQTNEDIRQTKELKALNNNAPSVDPLRYLPDKKTTTETVTLAPLSKYWKQEPTTSKKNVEQFGLNQGLYDLIHGVK